MSDQQNMNNIEDNDDTELISQVLNEMSAEDNNINPNTNSNDTVNDTANDNDYAHEMENLQNMDYSNDDEPEQYNEHYIDNNENNEQYYDEEEIDNDFNDLPEIKRTLLEKILYELKEPFLVFILYVVLSNPLINNFLSKTFPIFKSNNLYRYLLLFIKAFLLSLLFYVFKKFML